MTATDTITVFTMTAPSTGSVEAIFNYAGVAGTPVPEPAVYVLLTAGLAVIVAAGRRRNHR